MTTSGQPAFRYIDLFAGIGGFAAVLEALGGDCVYSVEIDAAASKVYELNWGHSPLGDITKDATDKVMNVPPHDVLAAGFPCQPFSKSGAQRGMEETRGTLYWNILKIIQAHHPTIVILENVRNLAGPRHKHEWDVIIETLRAEGYYVSSTPAVFSPHLLPRALGGRPQVRERVFITATYDPDGVMNGVEAEPPLKHVSMRDGEEWDLIDDLHVERGPVPGTALTVDETRWIDAWDDFVQVMWAALRARSSATSLPGVPIWSDHWTTAERLERWIAGERTSPYRYATDLPERWDDVPRWKQNFLSKNAALYTEHRDILDAWRARHDLRSFPASRRKFEWQAQQAPSLWDCVLQLRPSGIRAKRATHLPALVAITQTPIIGPLRRRLSVREAARLQGFPEAFDFGDQPDSATYKQLGNGVNIGAVWNVLKAHAERDRTILESTSEGRRLARALIDDAGKTPDEVLPGVLALRQSARGMTPSRS